MKEVSIEKLPPDYINYIANNVDVPRIIGG